MCEDPEPKINLPQHDSFTSARPAQPRAMGDGRVVVRCGASGKTQLKDLRQAGSTKVVFPQNHGAALEAIIVNTAGGITGGDRFTLKARADTGAALTLTTQAAERAYRAQSGEIGCVTTSLSVASGARMNWLPQELILFENCALQRKLKVALADDAEFLMVEPVVFGRTAMAETLQQIRFHDRIAITRNDKPIYLDGMDMVGDAAAHMARPGIAAGANAMTSLILVRPDAARQVATLRKMLPATAGVSLIADDVLVMRHLATDSFTLRRDLVPVLDHLTNNSLPISWRL